MPDRLTGASGQRPVEWVDGLAEGVRQALAKGKPLFVYVKATWCPVCKRLDEELRQPAVQGELRHWVCVVVDMDEAAQDAWELKVTSVPALRLRTPAGRPVAERDGFVTGDALVEWLREHYQSARAAADEVLLGSGRPDALGVVRLIRRFGERNPAIREAAVRRLLPYPKAAGMAVVDAFRRGNLAERLTALELLAAWGAPVQGLDPWQPETVTEQRLAALERWAENPQSEAPARPDKLSQEQLAEARRQIARMLGATDAEAAAIREQLARFGPALLEEVYRQLRQTTDDHQRHRLMALRYRLVASDRLVFTWPGGVLRLASLDLNQRRQAAAELAQRASADDEALLLELFSDPDPLIRETSLRGLKQIGGRQAVSALVRLLDDPEPNVRAAVLKLLEESPDPRMVPKVAEYVQREKDPDLIVHAVRFLRSSGTTTALRSLIGLLDHPSWQVRAEAAAGLAGDEDWWDSPFASRTLDARLGRNLELQADIYAALLKLLDDPDPFVVSRAVYGLRGVDMEMAVPYLLRAAERHQELAAQIVSILAGGQRMRRKALPHLHKFSHHENPAVRAAAIVELCRIVPHAATEEIAAGLEDPEPSVRVAVASALFEHFDVPSWPLARRASLLWYILSGRTTTTVLPAEQPAGQPSPIEEMASGLKRLFSDAAGSSAPATPAEAPAKVPPSSDQGPPKTPQTDTGQEARRAQGAEEGHPKEDDVNLAARAWEATLEDTYRGRVGYGWMQPMIPALEKMLQAESAEERLAAAKVLIPLGKGDAALPVLRQVIVEHPRLFSSACEVLPWLTWERRLETFSFLRQRVPDADGYSMLIRSMASVPDSRAASVFWDELADETAEAPYMEAIQRGLLAAYTGRPYVEESVSSSALRRLLQAARQRAESGTRAQRLVALTVLAGYAPQDAADLAEQMMQDNSLDREFHMAAFQVLLLTTTRRDATKKAVAALAQEDAQRRKLALMYLAGDRYQLAELPGGLKVITDGSLAALAGHEPGVPEPPPGLQPDQLRPLLDDADPSVAAYAGYLLALFGDERGLLPLLDFWRQKGEPNRQLTRLVYRAIASSNDPSYVPVLEEIYGRLDEYEMRDFYWTIRIMTGPEILRLRKRIREEVGMENLR